MSFALSSLPPQPHTLVTPLPSPQMLWNWHTTNTCFLTAGWQATTPGAFAGSCLVALLLAVLLEFLRRLGRDHDGRVLRAMHARAALLPPDDDDDGDDKRHRGVATLRATPRQQLGRAALHAAALAVAYLVMLLAMSYNGYVLGCIVVGAGLGKFGCDWMVRTVGVGERGAGREKEEEETTLCCG